MPVKKRLFIVIFLMILSTSSIAKSLSLVDSCTDLINIYDSKESQRLLAAQTTSLSQSLRAGYCLGVIQQYKKNRGYCYKNWFEQAKFIASYELKNTYLSDDELLEQSCDVR
ncbi:hypothetical protein WAX86_19455 [Photobacterium damselae subsp. damselae]|uniref:hypothetical protein n=1 Tax=Photobacterium damselae TaxID=38293 RepID=UPI001F3475B5|nr:hypothetical protein [Photobacterium damselae]UKA11943.1 hypothetical protein IHC91_19440 [Photobacterium damselae subsp. damselae]